MSEIYGLLCPATGELRYIGKANDAGKRLKSHLRDARRRRTPLYDWINALGAAPVLIVLDSVSDWQTAERLWIAEGRESGARLLNLADGGVEPHCPPAVRKANAVALNARLDADPKAKRVRDIKRALAGGLRAGSVSNAARADLRLAARKAPHLFGEYRNIPDRHEGAHVASV